MATPPRYRDATGAIRCSNCGAYKAGYCSMFLRRVKADYVCAKWYRRGGRKPSP